MAGLLLGVIGLARAAKADPAFSVSADRLSARPGDTITFRIVQDLKGTPLDRREFTLDGYRIDWELGEHPWRATPGTHVLRLYLRYLDDESLFQDGCDHLMKARLHGGGYSKIFGRNPISLMELSIGPNGEYMEINRDRGHMGMCVATTQKCAEILWHQDVDLYGMKFHEDEKPRILLGLE